MKQQLCWQFNSLLSEYEHVSMYGMHSVISFDLIVVLIELNLKQQQWRGAESGLFVGYINIIIPYISLFHYFIISRVQLIPR